MENIGEGCFTIGNFIAKEELIHTAAFLPKNTGEQQTKNIEKDARSSIFYWNKSEIPEHEYETLEAYLLTVYYIDVLVRNIG